MILEHAEDLANFINELQAETDRGLPLVGSALIDDKLHSTLKSFLIIRKSSDKLLSDPYAPLGTFSAKIEACYSMGLIDDFEYHEIGIIRKIRNQFAHAKHGLSFDNKKIIGLCTSLESPLPEGSDYPVNSTRFRLINSIVCIVLRLYYRPEWVANERRKSRKWVPDSRWYNTNENPPPKNVGFLGLVPKSNHK